MIANQQHRESTFKSDIAVYLRVSTTSQTEAAQKYDVVRWLNGQGIDPESVEWYVDVESGDFMIRDEFDRLQADVFHGYIKTIVVSKLDRVSRKMRDGINTIGDWLDKGTRLVSVTQQLDFTGTVGRLVAAVLFAVAEMEQEIRRERQASGIAVAKKLNKYAGRNPGYRKGQPLRAARLAEMQLTHTEIAKAMGISRRSVKRYLDELDKQNS